MGKLKIKFIFVFNNMLFSHFLKDIKNNKNRFFAIIFKQMHFIFNFPNQMFQFLFFWSWIGPNKVMTLKKPWNYFEKPMSSSDLVCIGRAGNSDDTTWSILHIPASKSVK